MTYIDYLKHEIILDEASTIVIEKFLMSQVMNN